MVLILFFSRGTSLKIWHNSGLFDREIKTYKELIKELEDITFVTYGSNEDLEFINEIHPIRLIHNKWKLPIDLYSFLFPFFYNSQLKKTSIFKTNQINGWWAAGLAKFIYKKPLVVRCGYLLSMNQEQKWKNYSQLRIKLVVLLEKWAFQYADAIIVTTPQMKSEAIKRHKISPEKITVIPNSVDVELFKPMTEVEKIEGRLGFIGRFTQQKNIHLLIEAVKDIKNASILLIGDGPLKSELLEKSKKLKVNVTFIGNVPNNKIPELLNTCHAFVLPSGWEGMPKALLEAMACGLPVIGTDAPGIRDVIDHGMSGLLCKHNATDISNAIMRIFSDNVLAENLGRHARQYIVKNFSLEKSVEKEIQLLTSLS